MNLKDIKPGMAVMVATHGWHASHVKSGRGGVLGIVLGTGQFRTQVQGACGEAIVVHSEFHPKNGVAVALLDNMKPNGRVSEGQYWTPTSESNWTLAVIRSSSIWPLGMFEEARIDLDNSAEEMVRLSQRAEVIREELRPLMAKAVASALKDGSLTVDAKSAYGPTFPSMGYLINTKGAAFGGDPMDHLKGAERELFRTLHHELQDNESRSAACYHRTYNRH